MQLSPSPGWAEKITLVLTGVLGTSVVASVIAFVNLILNRRKPKSEVNQIDANTEAIQIGNVIKTTDQMWTMQLRLNQLEAELNNKIQERRRENEFLRQQINYFEDLELANRNRMHAMAGELGNLVIHITNLERQMRDEKLEFYSYKVRNFEEIVKEFPLPTRDHSEEKSE